MEITRDRTKIDPYSPYTENFTEQIYDKKIEPSKATFGKYDPDEFRAWVQENKTLEKIDKTMSMKNAVSTFVQNGDYLKLGGFGQVRTSMAGIFEIIKQKKCDLKVAGHTTSHDLDVLLAASCVSKVEVAYSFAHEFRPLRSKVGGRLIKSGKLQVSEWSNATFSWRLKAAAMGLSFIPSRSLLGTDTFEFSGAHKTTCPFTQKTYAALPALYPDVAIIHVDRCDKYGNCQIDGMVVSDDDAARASRRVIISTERIVDEEVFLKSPGRTTIPYYLVDAVVETPFGSYPCEHPGHYWFDEHHIAEYVKSTFDEETLNDYLEKYYYSAKNWKDHLEKTGGISNLENLQKIATKETQPPLISEVWSK
jgi:acyl CoA:acetate/3-ketoacid CoA transferase alpha subunit